MCRGKVAMEYLDLGGALCYCCLCIYLRCRIYMYYVWAVYCERSVTSFVVVVVVVVFGVLVIAFACRFWFRCCCYCCLASFAPAPRNNLPPMASKETQKPHRSVNEKGTRSCRTCSTAIVDLSLACCISLHHPWCTVCSRPNVTVGRSGSIARDS